MSTLSTLVTALKVVIYPVILLLAVHDLIRDAEDAEAAKSSQD
jgi:hypothetical protein